MGNKDRNWGGGEKKSSEEDLGGGPWKRIKVGGGAVEGLLSILSKCVRRHSRGRRGKKPESLGEKLGCIDDEPKNGMG